jgi:hypothetical protein
VRINKGMNQNGMYYKVTQEYLYLNRKKKELISERDNIGAKIELIDTILTDLNDILCKHGNHIYEHFEENESQKCEDKE